MKTVQEYLRNFDHQVLINEYFDRIKEEIYQTYSKDMPYKSLFEITKITKNRISEFINTLLNFEISEKPECLLFAYEGYRFDYVTEPVTSMIKIKDLIEISNLELIEHYAYEFTENAKIMNFVIADSDYTQNHLKEVLTDVLYEASFFGYDESCKEKERNLLDQTIKEVESNLEIFKSWSDFKKELFSDISFYSQDTREKELSNKINECIQEYNIYSSTKQLNLIKEIIINEIN